MALSYSTDKYALGYNLAAPAGVYPQTIAFTTRTAPGGSIQPSATFISSDLINLFWIPTPGRLYNYRIEIPVLDGAASATLGFNLVDGSGNVLQSGITKAQSFNSGGTITDASANPNLIGQFDYNTPSIAWVALKVTTTPVAKVSATADVQGNVLVKQN